MQSAHKAAKVTTQPQHLTPSSHTTIPKITQSQQAMTTIIPKAVLECTTSEADMHACLLSKHTQAAGVAACAQLDNKNLFGD